MLTRTAKTVRSSAAQENDNHLLTPLEMINQRLLIETRSALTSWAFIEKSYIFNKSKKSFCLVEQTYRQDITPLLYMNLFNAWREVLMTFFRLTDQAETGGETFPAFLKEYNGMDYEAYAKKNDRTSLLALGFEKKWEEHFAKCQTVAEKMKTHCYIKFKDTQKGRGEKLGILRELLKKELRDTLLAHAGKSDSILLADYKKEVRQAMIFIASFTDATEFITYGRTADMYSFFRIQCSSAEKYWAMCDKGISEY